MSDIFLPGNGFDTYESQDKALMYMDGSQRAAVAVRILQQQGFAVAGAAVRLSADGVAQANAAKQAAEALGIECIILNAEALEAEDLPCGDQPLFAALLTAADKLGIQYIAAPLFARIELEADGLSCVCPAACTSCDESAQLCNLPQQTLARLILPLGDFSPADVQEMAQEFGL